MFFTHHFLRSLMNDPEAEPRGIKMTFLFASDPEGRGFKPKNH